MHEIPPLIVLLALGFGFALVFGLLTNWMKLSPIVGYLIAGILLGGNTPGPSADEHLATALGEIGVILLMFGVGLHFKIQELMRVRWVAIPGAVFQSVCAVGLTMALIPLFDLRVSTAVVMGIAISVASTVLLIRVLTDANVLHSQQGHIAVGWLIVEDLFTIAVLLILPIVKESRNQTDGATIVFEILRALGGIVAAIVLIVVVGKRLFPLLMNVVARTRSRELFVLATLVLSIGVALGSAKLFGISMALGAFLAGIVVAQSDVGHEAAAQALPFRDAFAVLFFVSVGMMFDPSTLSQHYDIIIGMLLIILIGKPLAAFLIVVLLKYPVRTALTVSIALGQVGEFTFILGALAKELHYFEQQHVGMLVICAIISISVNPLMFRAIPWMEQKVLSLPRLGPYLRERGITEEQRRMMSTSREMLPSVIVVGYGPVGRTIVENLKMRGVESSIVDMNIDTVKNLKENGQLAFFGDAENKETMEGIGMEFARYLILTIPDPDTRATIIATARRLNPEITIFARTRYNSEEAALSAIGVNTIASEEAVVASELSRAVLAQIAPATS
ncbi:cation:proton antiporter [Candidatus Sumerlaeota bacterium]|nr:cation:proton antiporter [Candidatus Sumerlaeota bacterium]